jgi:DNA-binding cell septation regulator SpoVG
MPVKLIEWKPRIKNSLRGFAKVQIGRSLVVNDVTVSVGASGPWVGLPGKLLLNADGSGQ